MNILAFDTTMAACSAAVLREAGGTAELFAAYERRERGHAEALLPMIEQVMAEAGLRYDDLGRIAVTLGPGTFTGVRVGVAAARGLLLATRAKAVGVDSLSVVAAAALEGLPAGADIIAVAADARRGQVYFALFDGEARPLGDPQALAAADAAGLLPVSGRVVLAGSAARAVADAAAARNRSIDAMLEGLQPDAAALARMAAGLKPQSGPLRPLYLRSPDARPQCDKAVPHL